ncbi:MAG TPA: hypothetical protein VNM89_06005 [Solirubrobacterales bacterium]|nr:hypothetical protein [Solirubrobacterales bacterium]
MLRAAGCGIAWLVGLVALIGAAGCGDDGEGKQEASAPLIERQSATLKQKARTETVAPSHCPPGLPSCRSAKGRITYIERVDPDGDGDAHFVIADPQGITLPGLTVIDVRKDLRPQPLPEEGDLISAAGPVQTGSYGQSQIHAIELHVSGR